MKWKTEYRNKNIHVYKYLCIKIYVYVCTG